MGVNGTAAAAAAGQPNVSCACNCQRSLFPSMEITELEFVQIVVIVVVMMVMVVMITCLLSHYKLSARSFISRHSQARRRDDGGLSSEGCLWPSESTVSGGMPEPQVYAPPRPTDRLAVPPSSSGAVSSPPTPTCSTKLPCHPPSRCLMGRSPHPTRAPAPSSYGTRSNSWS